MNNYSMNNQSEIQFLPSKVTNLKAMQRKMKKIQKIYEALDEEKKGLIEVNERLYLKNEALDEEKKMLKEEVQRLYDELNWERNMRKYLEEKLQGLNVENKGLRSTLRALSQSPREIGKAS